MPHEQCGPRVVEPGQRLKELQGRKAKLEEAAAGADRRGPGQETLTEIRALLDDAFHDGSPELRKTVFRALVEEVRIEDDNALPTYRLAWSVVRNIGPLVVPIEHNTNRSATFEAGALDQSAAR